MRIYDYSELATAYLELGSYKAVREKYGCTIRTVTKAVTEAGLNVGKGGNQSAKKKISDDDLKKCASFMTRKEIALKYGMHVTNVDRRLRRLNINAVSYNDVQMHNLDDWHKTLGGDDFIKKHTDGAFVFVSYRRGRYKIKCNSCGTIIERAKSTIAKCNPECECKKQRMIEHNLRQDMYKYLEIQIEAIMPKVCEHCGSVFYSQSKNAKWCSEACRHKGNKRGTHRRRARRYDCFYDNTVKLKTVYKRDKGICGICGKPTDWESKGWTGYFGPDYPTIDHIIPLSKGGAHSWDNVQLAHAMCNSTKRDLLNYRAERRA